MRRLPGPAGAAERVRYQRWRTRLAAATRRDMFPPHPSRFGAFGTNSVLVPPSRVTCPDRIFVGDGVIVLEHSWLSVIRAIPGVEPTLRVGDRSRLGRFALVACIGSVEIGDDVLCSDRVFIGDSYHGYEDPELPVKAQPMVEPKPVKIGDGSFLGVASIVTMGVTIGEHAYVGAGAVVTKDVDPYTVVVGNPARPVRRWDPDTARWIDF